MTDSPMGVTGVVVVERHNAAGELVERCETHNLVTSVGDQFYAGRAALASSLPAAATGMRLGTGSTTPSKTGAGAAIVTKLTDGNQGFDSTYPQVSAGVVTYKVTYAAGKATSASTAITEVVIVNDTIATDTATAASLTIARALISGISSKQAGDTLTVTWTHTILGA